MADYNAMKVADLRDELKRRGISSTGLSRKVQIIEAIEEDDNNAGSPANQVNESDVPTVERPAEEEEEPATEPATKDESNELTVPETEKPAETTIPKVASPAAEEASSESRKRKRGSQSPPASPDSTDTKKVKTSDDAANEVKQPDPEQIVNEVKMSDPEPQVKKTDEEVAEEAPAPVVGEVAGTEAKPDATSIPMSTSDDTKLPPEDIWKGYEVKPESTKLVDENHAERRDEEANAKGSNADPNCRRTTRHHKPRHRNGGRFSTLCSPTYSLPLHQQPSSPPSRAATS